MDRFPTAPGLPETAYAVHLVDGSLIIIARGEEGYYPYAEPSPANEQVAATLNAKMGVSAAQAAAMVAGSIFGWHVPGADPARYTDDGRLKAA